MALRSCKKSNSFKFWIFSVCAPPPPPPSLVGAYYLHPPDARAIFLHNDLLCNGTCSVTGGRITYWGGTNGKDPKFFVKPNVHTKTLTIDSDSLNSFETDSMQKSYNL